MIDRTKSEPGEHQGRAGGKAILLGEHAVVHGKPALVAGLPGGVIARDLGLASTLTVRIPRWDLEIVASNTGDMAARGLAALNAALAGHGISNEHRSRLIVVDALIPPRAGLGSSAALAVGVCRLIASVAGRQDLCTSRRAASIAGASELIFHGRPSGVDAAAAASGGVSIFTSKEGSRPLQHTSPLHLVVADTGIRPATEEMVELVSARIAEEPSARAVLFRLGDLAKTGAEALSRDDLSAIGEAMNEAHGLLAELGVSTAALDQLTQECRELGALGAKLTGAGGGGCMVALCEHETAGIVLRHLEGRGGWARLFTIEPPRTDSNQEPEHQAHV